MNDKQRILQKIAKLLRIITFILAILVAVFMIDTFLIRGNINNSVENPEDFYNKSTEIEYDNRIISLDDTEIVIEKEVLDINGIKWNTIYIPKWQIKLDIPAKLLEDGRVKRDGQSIVFEQPSTYKIIVENNQLTESEYSTINKEFNSLKNQSERAGMHLNDNEKYLNSHVDFTILDNVKLLISNFTENNNKIFGYKYSLIRDNNILSVKCTQPISSKISLLTVDTTYLRQIVNMITIVDK